MIELQVIKALLTKNTWIEYRKYVNKKQLTKELSTLLEILDNYHTQNDTDLTVSEFEIVAETSGKIDKTHRAILDTMQSEEVNPDLISKLLQAYKQKSVLSQLALVSYDASEGRKGIEEVNKLVKQLDTVDELVEESNLSFVTDDLEILHQEAFATPGLRWRLDTLNKSLGSLRKGDFGFVFARPETGKTTFLTSEITYMALQADRPVLWLNNEEQSNKVMLRCYQSVLGYTNIELFRDVVSARNQFQQQMQGRLRIYDIVSANARDIEKLCESVNPALIVFDQIDKVKGFDSDREDLRLGSIYQWARELAKTYGPVIGITQADGTGENQRWLTMNNVANAKTSKQAEADWILGIGKIHDIGYDQLRFLHLSKNKLAGDEDTIPELRHGRMEVMINPAIGRYEDMPK
jgi:replicative DNA helicase